MMETKRAGRGAPGVSDWLRQMDALGRQVDDPEALAQALGILAHLEGQVADAVQRLRGEGFSDSEMARAVGVSRQAITKRWPRAERAA